MTAAKNSSSNKAAWFGTLVLLSIFWTLFTLELYASRARASHVTTSYIPKPHHIPTADIAGLALGEPLLGTSETSTQLEEPAVVNESDEETTPPTEQLESPTTGIVVQTAATSLQDSQGTPPHVLDRTLILYAFSETPAALINLKFFISHGLHAAADFIFIFNGPTNATSLIPAAPNIKYVERPNDCYDLGAYAEVLTTNHLHKHYSKFIMLNASLRGPFLPYWSEACWSDMYVRKLTDEVKLVGMTANCWPRFHVQSMIWATDSIGISLLLYPHPALISKLSARPSYDPLTAKISVDAPVPPGINACFHTWGEAVSAEIGVTALVEAAGFKVDVMMMAYHGREKYEEDCDSSKNGDVLFEKKYFGTNVHPFETGFLKSERGIDPVGLEKLTEWTAGRRFSSYDYCVA